MSYGILLLRLVVGLAFVGHGTQKLFGWFGGHGLSGTGSGLESMGLRPGRVYAAVNGLAEFGGGALLVVGLLTPLGAAAVAGVMFVAIATVHWTNGFFNTRGGYEFNLLIIASAIALAFTGPGKISIDHLAGWTLAGPAWGLGALGISAAAAGSVLALRKQPRPDQEPDEKPPDEVHAT